MLKILHTVENKKKERKKLGAFRLLRGFITACEIKKVCKHSLKGEEKRRKRKFPLRKQIYV